MEAVLVVGGVLAINAIAIMVVLAVAASGLRRR
jgi:hypothetical protein